nr:MAG TPA: hypothetical protein [Caudoviricetes sp.]
MLSCISFLSGKIKSTFSPVSLITGSSTCFV